MKLSLFKKGLRVEKLMGYLDIIKGYADDRELPYSKCYEIEELSNDDVSYSYYCAFSTGVINQVYFLKHDSGLIGLSTYDLNMKKVYDLSDCSFSGIRCVCDDTFLLETPFGQSTLFVKGKEVISDVDFIEVYSLCNLIYVYRVLDMYGKYFYVGFSIIEDTFYIFSSVKNFFNDMSSMLKGLYRLSYLDVVPIGVIRSFMAEMSGKMNVDGLF